MEKIVKLTEEQVTLLENVFALALEAVNGNVNADAVTKKKVSKEIHSFEDVVNEFVTYHNNEKIHKEDCKCGCELPF